MQRQLGRCPSSSPDDAPRGTWWTGPLALLEHGMRVLAARLPDVAVPVYVAVLAVLGATAAWRAPETAFAALPTHVSPPEPMITPLTEGLPGY